MKSSFKKSIKLITLMMAFLLVFSACASSSPVKNDPTIASNTTSSTASGTTAQPATAPAEPPAELTIGFYMNVNTPKDMQLVIDEVNKILIKDINAKITNIVALNLGNYIDQITLMLSGNENLDAFLVRPGANFINYVSRGQVIELDELIAKYGQGIVKAIGQEFLDAGVVNGKQYGLTTNRDLAKSYGFTIDKSFVDKYNIDYKNIKSMEDMGKAFQTIVEKEPKITPWVSIPGTNALLEWLCKMDNLTDTYGVLMNYGQDSKLSVVDLFETKEYEEQVRVMRDFYQKGYIQKDIMTTSDSPYDLYRAGTAFAMSTGLKPGLEIQDSMLVGKDLVTATIAPAFTTSTIVQTVQWCIARNSKEPEASMKFLNKMYSDPAVTNLLAWGIEGKHYTKKSDGLIGYPEGINKDNSGFILNLGWAFGNQFITHVWEGNSPTVWKDTDTFNRSAIKSNAFGFVYNNSAVKTEVAAVTNVANQYRSGLEFGVLDPDKALPEFIAKLKDAGIDKIILEKQKQLDEWLKNKK